MRHDRGVLGKRFDTAEAFGTGEDAEAFQESTRAFESPLENDGNHRARPAHLSRSELMPGMRRQARVVDTQHARMTREPLRQRRRGCDLLSDARAERLQPSQHEIAVERARYGT